MKRDSFIFYRSFMEALEDLTDKQYAKVFRAITKFAFNGEETELTGVEKVIFSLIKPQLIANQKRYENGCKGGRKPSEDNQNETKTKPNDNQNESTLKPNENDNVNDNVNDNDNNIRKKERKEINLKENNNAHDTYDEIISDFEFSVPVENKVKSFLRHCLLNKQVFSNDRLESMLVRLDMKYQTDDEKLKALDDAIQCGYYTIKA